MVLSLQLHFLMATIHIFHMNGIFKKAKEHKELWQIKLERTLTRNITLNLHLIRQMKKIKLLRCSISLFRRHQYSFESTNVYFVVLNRTSQMRPELLNKTTKLNTFYFIFTSKWPMQRLKIIIFNENKIKRQKKACAANFALSKYVLARKITNCVVFFFWWTHIIWLMWRLTMRNARMYLLKKK